MGGRRAEPGAPAALLPLDQDPARSVDSADDLADPSVVLEHVDHADVGQRRHDRADRVLERSIGLERLEEHLAEVGQQHGVGRAVTAALRRIFSRAWSTSRSCSALAARTRSAWASTTSAGSPRTARSRLSLGGSGPRSMSA